MPTAQNSLPTDFDDDDPVAESKPECSTAAVKDEDGVPYCLNHHVRMKQTSAGKKGSAISYFGCPVDGCQERAKRIKTRNESSIPTEPACCPRCSKGKEKVVLERVKRLSTGFYTILGCTVCNYKSSPMPRPEYVASQQRQKSREHVADIGDR